MTVDDNAYKALNVEQQARIDALIEAGDLSTGLEHSATIQFTQGCYAPENTPPVDVGGASHEREH